MTNNIKIMNLEASEVLKNNLEEISINKDYNGVFASSLLLKKLKSIGLKVDIKQHNTKDIIMLNFKYGYTPQSAKDIEFEIIRNKKTIDNNIETKKALTDDRKLQKNNLMKKLFTGQINRLAEDNRILKADNVILDAQIEKSKIKKEAIRNKLYVEGFHLDFYKKNKETKEYYKASVINYRFWFRSPSKSKTGSVCFINSKLYKEINVWQTMDIKLPEKEAKLVEMEAYKSLTSSNIESEITINPYTQILVVNDLDSYIDEMCSKVYTDKKGECKVKDGIMKIKNTLFDGMALISDDLFKGENGMMVLRQHFYKSCGFRTYIAKFMKAYYGDKYETATTKDKYGRNIFVKDIKMICTENTMKWEKFDISYTDWCDKVHEDNDIFGVCKVDHKSKYGQYQRMSFQMIGTLPIDEKQSLELCKDTIDYVNSLKDDNIKFIAYLENTKSDLNANAMMIDLFNNNTGFYNSDLFRKFKTSTISEYKETLRAGKLLTNSDNLTIAGNPYSLLLHSVGALDKYITYDTEKKAYIIDGYEDITLPTLEKGKGVSVYTTRFENEELCAFRSPHNSPNNIMYFVNKRTNPIMDKYFNFSENIIAINLIKTNCQSRGNGFDEDADFVYVTNNSVCIKGAIDAQKFNTIENCIEQSGKKYNNTMLDLATIDNNLAKSKYSIGLSSNLAILAMTWYWNDQTNKDLKDLVCICSILAQCSIDNSKRSFNVNLEKEIARISKLDCMQIKINSKKEMVFVNKDATEKETKEFNKLKLAKPYFWKFIKTMKEKKADKITEKDNAKKQQLIIIQKQKNSKEKKAKIAKLESHCIEKKICAMDFIQDGIDTIKNNYCNDKCTEDISFVQLLEGNARAKQQTKVKDIVKELDDMYIKHFDELTEGKKIDDDDWKVEQQIKSTDSIVKIKKMTLTAKTMQMLIASTLCNNAKNKRYKRRMLNCLYNAQPKRFMECFKKCLLK